ncbi:MAG: non-heme iron oxygenase ferredoxin subunit [Acidimicrobiia bacterium]
MSRVVVCAVGDVPAGEAKRFDVGGYRIAVVHCGERFHVIDDRCTHADVSLAEGEVDCASLQIECWKHGSAFSLTDGKPQSFPATRPVPVYPVEIVGDDVVVVFQ